MTLKYRISRIYNKICQLTHGRRVNERIMRYKLSIIIVTYNRPMEVIRAIKSCLPFDINSTEMIIWDNHSEKGNSMIVKKYCTDCHLPIRYFYSEYNLGPGGGRNAAWLKCDSEYVFTMDDDAVIGSRDFFERIVEYMDCHKEAGAAYVNIEEPDTGHIYKCLIRDQVNSVVRTLAYVGGANIIRRSLFPQENLYPTDFMFGSEETYASLIIWDNAQEVHEIGDLTVLHLPTAHNRVLGKERDLQIIVSAYLVKKALYPVCLIPLCRLVLVLRIYKNKLNRIECKQLIKKYSDIVAEKRICMKTLINLCKRFGGLINLL